MEFLSRPIEDEEYATLARVARSLDAQPFRSGPAQSIEIHFIFHVASIV